ncbi:MAG: general secretion pathway protein GspK [Candidatus Hydrogenedentes bacterium]|nr:general secretion pathway protein GspK [Candidatus Hydrogenedentota bacterium]
MRARNEESGFVLICVIWVVALLTVITMGFNHRARLDRKAAVYSLDRDLAMAQARGAVQRGMVEVRNKYLKDLLDPNQVFSTHLGQDWARETNLLQDGEYFLPQENFDNDGVWFYIEDMERRFNVNQPRDIFEHLPQISTGALRNIHHRLGFGGKEVLLVRQPFQAVEEVRFIRGISEEDWKGDDDKPGLRTILTTEGSGFININTAAEEVLMSIPNFSQKIVDRVLGFRAGGDGVLNTPDDRGFRDIEDVLKTLAIEGRSAEAIKRYCTCNSNYFKITGVATRRQGKVRAQCAAVIRLDTDFNYPPQLISWEETPLGA